MWKLGKLVGKVVTSGKWGKWLHTFLVVVPKGIKTKVGSKRVGKMWVGE